MSGPAVEVADGRKQETGSEFFQRRPPIVRFAHGSSVRGNDHLKLKHDIGLFPAASLEERDWTGVNLRHESQGMLPLTDSIQYHMIQELRQGDYDIIYDDDSKGEAADVVTLKLHPDRIAVELFHLKYATQGQVGNAVKNLYEVCGQTQRSVHWQHHRPDELLLHLLRRRSKTEHGVTRDRLEQGTMQDLLRMRKLAKRHLPVVYAFIIVQPAISRANVGPEVLKLLGVTQNLVQELAGVPLRIISSA